ncbi:MAG: hypothetical protein ABR573_00475, partial [Candidatus Dormibacteria bacterium]
MAPPAPVLTTEDVVAAALSGGWVAAGVGPIAPLQPAGERALDAIEAGSMAGMSWMSPERIESAADPGRRYPWARSVLALAWPYRPAGTLTALAAGDVLPDPSGTPNASGTPRPRGRMASYTCLEGDPGPEGKGRPEDYHEVMGRACDELLSYLRTRAPGLRAKRFIDHGWALDRALAESAGIGFCGKNTTLITVAAGSYVLLAELLL